jgi:putative addiction module CopG family antidote
VDVTLPFKLKQFVEREIKAGRFKNSSDAISEGLRLLKQRDDLAAHDLVIRATDVRACTPRQIPSVLKQWRHPEHEEFQARTLWSLFNSFTEVLKGNLNDLPKRTEALHGLLDAYAGLTKFS